MKTRTRILWVCKWVSILTNKKPLVWIWMCLNFRFNYDDRSASALTTQNRKSRQKVICETRKTPKSLLIKVQSSSLQLSGKDFCLWHVVLVYFFADFGHVNVRWNTVRWDTGILYRSKFMNFRVGSRNPVTLKTISSL